MPDESMINYYLATISGKHQLNLADPSAPKETQPTDTSNAAPPANSAAAPPPPPPISQGKVLPSAAAKSNMSASVPGSLFHSLPTPMGGKV